jgi:hypothetical protein
MKTFELCISKSQFLELLPNNNLGHLPETITTLEIRKYLCPITNAGHTTDVCLRLLYVTGCALHVNGFGRDVEYA